jgi:hypothetical protein
MAFLESASSKPAFIIGVTGHMDLDPGQNEKVKAALESVFRWLQTKKRIKGIGHPGLGLKDTPIILLSSLAPGADQWTAKAAGASPHMEVLAPLPFFKDQYLQSTSFQRDGVEEHQKKVLADFPDEKTFVVRETDELGCDEETLRQKYQPILTGPEGKEDRDRRYLAAGEYVAAYSDILLALTSGSVGQLESAALLRRQSPGANAIVQRKLRGMFSRIPAAPALAGSGSGPVIHICAPKRDDPSPANEKCEAGHIEILFPYDSRPAHVPEESFQDVKWQRNGYKSLVQVAKNLQQLNKERVPIDSKKLEEAFAEMLPDGDKALASNQALLDKLKKLSQLRRQIADYNRHYDSSVKKLRQTLFGLAFFSASLFVCAENWAPISDLWRNICFWFAVGGTLIAWIVFVSFRSKGLRSLFSFLRGGGLDAGNSDDQRADDYRAIAEGLRVQFYWLASGTGESVVSNYLQRQQNEVGWMRNVIRTAAFPYEPMRYSFRSLSRENWRTLLAGIREGWTRKQSEYFSKNISNLKKRRSFFEHYSAVMLLAAFALSIYNFVYQAASPRLLTRTQGNCLSGAALVIFGLLAGVWLLKASKKEDKKTDVSKKDDQKAHKSRKPLPDRVLQALFWVLNLFLPGPPESRIWRYFLRGVLVLAITGLVLGVAYYCRGIYPWVPAPIKTSTILRNLLLAGGVLCAVWVSANHLTENIRRYESMEAMFKNADERFNEYLKSWADNDKVDEEVLSEIRSLILAVGREALSENSEWLFTHRARPIEPVSA